MYHNCYTYDMRFLFFLQLPSFASSSSVSPSSLDMTPMSLRTNTTLLLPNPIRTLLSRKSSTMIATGGSIRRLGPIGKPVWTVHIGISAGLADFLSRALAAAVRLGGAEVGMRVAGVLLQARAEQEERGERRGESALSKRRAGRSRGWTHFVVLCVLSVLADRFPKEEAEQSEAKERKEVSVSLLSSSSRSSHPLPSPSRSQLSAAPTLTPSNLPRVCSSPRNRAYRPPLAGELMASCWLEAGSW